MKSLVTITALCTFAFLLLTACNYTSKKETSEPLSGQFDSIIEEVEEQNDTSIEPAVTVTPSSTTTIIQDQTDVANQEIENESCASSEQDIFKEAALSDELIEKYFYTFIDFFSPDEYINLCETADSMSARLSKPINQNLYIVAQDNSTYSKVSRKYLILDISGNIVKEYSENGWGPNVYHVGKFSFVNKYDGNYENPPYRDDEYDIYDSNGVLVGLFQSPGLIEQLTDLNNDYILFTTVSNGWYNFYLIDSDGNYSMLMFPDRDYKPVSVEDNVKAGKIINNLFSLQYRSIDGEAGDYYAMYFNTAGELVIDLSSVVTNFDVYELGDFHDGLAEIKFIGADGKDYTGIIDENGEFVCEPITSEVS